MRLAAGRGLSWVNKDVRDQREPADKPPVDLVGDVLGPVGADLVVERHPGGDDEMVRAKVHGAQVDCPGQLGETWLALTTRAEALDRGRGQPSLHAVE